MTRHVTIEHATIGDTGWVADLIATAFHPLAVAQWLVPDPTRRTRVLAATFRIHIDHALTHGLVHITSDRSGAAVWFTRNRPLPEPDDYPQRLATACGERLDRFQLLDELFDQHHPTEPHHHLAFLAVAPDQQHRGVGTALLAHHHRHLDAHHTAAYLEASNTHNRALYLRHGYVSATPCHLPDGTPMWPMWRPPDADTTP